MIVDYVIASYMSTCCLPRGVQEQHHVVSIFGNAMRASTITLRLRCSSHSLSDECVPKLGTVNMDC